MTISSSFLGSWKLISCEYRGATRTAYPFGTDPEGLLIYDSAGWMSVQIMHRNYGQEFQTFNSSSNQNRASFNGYLAYFATVEIDEEKSLISHHVFGSTLSQWIGSVQQRTFEFIEGNLILSSPATSRGNEVLAVLTWTRV